MISLAFLGCQPSALAPPMDACPEARVPAGEVLVAAIACDAQIPEGGEGRRSDYIMANSVFRAVVRHPQAALTALGVGGGTVIDAAPWEFRDRLHEAIPLVDGGWLDVESFELGDDRVSIRGLVRSLPGRPVTEGAAREVSWVIQPDEPWLRLEGADGLYLHPDGDFSLLDGQLINYNLVYGHDGGVVEDLGGAIRVDGATALLVEPSDTAYSSLFPDGQALLGTADGAEELRLLAEGEEVGRVRVFSNGAVDVRVAPAVDAVQAVAQGYASSEMAIPSSELSLALGPPGQIRLDLAWADEGERPIGVHWADQDRAGFQLLPPSGGVLALGAGVYDLRLTGGPTIAHRELRVEVPAEREVVLGVAMERLFDPGARVLARLGHAANPSRGWRGVDNDLGQRVIAEGVGFVVVAPEDDVSDFDMYRSDRGWLAVRDGSSITSSAGWSVVSWPWAASPRRSGHGAAYIQQFGADDALAAAYGGDGASRFTIVDQAWLEAAPPVFEISPQPDFLRLSAPGEDFAAWDDWFAWLDAGVDLVPVGELTWVSVADGERYGAVDVEDGLIRGRVVATTGPVLLLDVDGFGPGEVVPVRHARPLRRAITVDARGAGLEEVALLGRGGQILERWAVDELPATIWTRPEGWVLAAGRSEGSWSATGPIWLDPP